MKFKILGIAFTVFLISSCSFNQEVKSKGQLFLQGKWEEGDVENKESLVNYQQHHFNFTCDSFYLQINSFSKVNLQGGACYDAKEWKEYAKGYYALVKDTLKFKGSFVNEKYRYKPENSCYRTGKYFEDFLVLSQQTDTLFLKSLQTGQTHQLLFKEKGTCNN